MSNIWVIAKKELYRFFTDKRMLFSTILLPGLMIYVMYTFMGEAFSNMFSPDESANTVYAVNMEDGGFAEENIKAMASAGNMDMVYASDKEEAMAQLADGNAVLVVLFPENFSQGVLEYETPDPSLSMPALSAPNIEVYYDSSNTASSLAYSTFVDILDNFESQLSNKFDVNKDIENYDINPSQDDGAGAVMTSMLPLLLTVFMFSACMGIVPESIAGEKERGTIATLLVTPISRSHLVIGKVLAMGIVALCSGISSFLGTFLSMPKLMGFAGDGSGGNMFENYAPIDFIMLLLIIFSTILLMVSIISILSAFAKTVKEAATYVSPLMVIVLIIALAGMLSQSVATDLAVYFIPIYNSVQSMTGIFAGDYVMVNVIASIVSNTVYTSLMVVVIAKMFQSESIIFAK